jgi:hypothetical protein
MIFVRVKKKPTELKADEFVIDAPNFLSDIENASVKKPNSNIMSINYLRQLVSDIGQKYVGQEFNALTDVNVAHFKGIPCETAEQAHEILQKLFRQNYPKMLNSYVEYHIKRRPNGTRIIYFLGSPAQVEPFLNLGFQEVLEKDLEKFMGTKPKKIVGKPAISDEEAAKKNETVV